MTEHERVWPQEKTGIACPRCRNKVLLAHSPKHSILVEIKCPECGYRDRKSVV